MHSIIVVIWANKSGHQLIILQFVINTRDPVIAKDDFVDLSDTLLSVSRLVHQISLEVLTDEASLPEQPCPHLDPHNPKDEEDKEAEEEDIAQHGQGVQE